MASGVPQCPYWPVLKNWPHSQRFQFKNNDVSARVNPVGNFGGIIWPKKYGEMCYLPVIARASSAVPVL